METILSGSFTGSPRLILSTFSMPSITLPHTVYFLSRKVASSNTMKNWLLALSGLCERAIEHTPRTCGSALNSALRFGYFEPPVPEVRCFDLRPVAVEIVDLEGQHLVLLPVRHLDRLQKEERRAITQAGEAVVPPERLEPEFGEEGERGLEIGAGRHERIECGR